MIKSNYVILIGAGRSGTKFLRRVLASADGVEEIPYDVGYVWRYGNEYFPSDEFKPEMANDKVIRYIRGTLPALVRTKSAEQVDTIIEKSVPNSLRVSFVNQVLPDAKFVHLVRDGRAVTESSIRMWNKAPDRGYLLNKLKYFPWKNYRYAAWYLSDLISSKLQHRPQIWGPRYSGIERDVLDRPLPAVCARQWRKCVEMAQHQLKQIPSSHLMEVRYEELINSVSCLEQLCDFIGIKDKEVVLQYFDSHVDKNNMNAWKDRVSQEVLDLIMTEISGTLCQLGYTEKN